MNMWILSILVVMKIEKVFSSLVAIVRRINIRLLPLDW